MASIKVVIHQHEKDEVVKVLKKFKDQTISVTKIAEQLKFNPNRTRFVVQELLDEGRIIKIPTKQFGTRFVRYKYEVKE